MTTTRLSVSDQAGANVIQAVNPATIQIDPFELQGGVSYVFRLTVRNFFDPANVYAHKDQNVYVTPTPLPNIRIFGPPEYQLELTSPLALSSLGKATTCD